MNFLAKQGGGYHSNYTRKGGVNVGVEIKVGKIEIVNGGTVIPI